ncbi:pilus assembly protein [Methylobacterium sp. NEAU 140]|uniref:TadE/TadG family type IV pilus assembly protein n=1 Tax=Methylobacterium sp. NEAU 140 TaxID=3064945 RepID=UPI0027326B7E|nr:TadE/TadG family type IV pilus assembly protein [Methylobacterium sp. NEAU 140]MDP4022474.1 pilus assembly protein [Methylobacterium sp. NEAU 140]
MPGRGTFSRDRRGSLAVIVALAAPALLVGIGGAIEMSRAVTFRQRLWSAVELSCIQSAAYVNAQKPQDVTVRSTTTTYPDMVADIAKRNFVAKNISIAPPPITLNTDTSVHVEATRDQNLVFSSLFNTIKMTFTAAKDCAVISTTVAKTTSTSMPEVLISESFEGNHNVGANSWSVLGGYNNSNTWNGWTTQAAGIEINSQISTSGTTILFGTYFAELDSDCGTSANSGNRSCKSNSTMSRILNLPAGTYQIRYQYLSRLRDWSIGNSVICGSTNSAVSYYTTEGQTNRIEVYVEKQGNYTYNAANMVDVCVQSNYWTERVINFTVPATANYRISWRAAGREDTFGGLIDNLLICRNYCPAS